MEDNKLYLIILSVVTTIYIFVRKFLKGISTLEIDSKSIKFSLKRKDKKNDKD